MHSAEDVRKYRDSVLWGAKVAGERMPSQLYESLDTYLGAYKKKFASAKKQGNVDAFSTDPIPITVYRLLLQWSVESNNIFSWLWTLLQWNCMARSASIDCLCFHNFSLGQDSIIIKYDESKADKAGEKLSEKNLYANPLEWTMCSWLAFGIYCSLLSDNLCESERLFLKKGTKEGTASWKYHEQILGLVKGNEATIMTHMKVERLNPYVYERERRHMQFPAQRRLHRFPPSLDVVNGPSAPCWTFTGILEVSVITTLVGSYVAWTLHILRLQHSPPTGQLQILLEMNSYKRQWCLCMVA